MAFWVKVSELIIRDNYGVSRNVNSNNYKGETYKLHCEETKEQFHDVILHFEVTPNLIVVKESLTKLGKTFPERKQIYLKTFSTTYGEN